jgi:hypothetical protein
MSEEPKKNQPEVKFQSGAVTATVWQNKKKVNGETKEWYTIGTERSYKDGDEWKTTSSMGVNDLPKLALVCNKAFEFCTKPKEKKED